MGASVRAQEPIVSFTVGSYFFWQKGVREMAKKEKRIDYISKAEDIRLIASGVNAEHRTMTWREATEYWERDNGTDDYGRAALMAYLGIATAGECALLDNLVDAPEDDAPTEEESE